MNHVTLLIAVIAAILSTCHAQDTMPRPRTCPEVRMQFTFIRCDGDEFEEKQCARGGAVCYCVDPMSGDRVDDITYTMDEFREVDCNDRDNRDDDRRDMMRCPDLADRIEECGGRNCIRRPNANETCIQCIPGCTSEDPMCRRDSDCAEGERCIISGDLGRLGCMAVRMIQENQTCVPDDDNDNDDDDDDDDDDGDGDDDYDDEEETFLERSTRDFDRRSEFGERECAGDLVCRRNGVDTAICQRRTGPCFQNDRRPTGADNSAPQLECDDDSGNFEPRQNNDRQHWCVYPMNGREINGTRRNRSMRLDCDRMVFQRCRIMINGRQYTVEHGEGAINFNMTRDVCGFCRCNNGSFEFCRRVECPYIRDDTDSQACTVNDRTIPHRMTYEDDCNMCRCLNGTVRCTDRDCSDDEDDDDDEVDMDNDFAECRRMPYSPVCATNMRTYPNKCTALAAGFERFEITPGACSRNNICERFPCMDGYRCVAVSSSCTGRNCTARDFRRCINTTQLMCRTESDLGMQERVCGLNNRTYPSICHMVQQSGTQVRFSQACNRSDCPDSPVCGTDGVTYRSLCDIRLQPDVRFDYRGACMTARNETVRYFCARVRNSSRCTMRRNCNSTVRPTDGCCPVCGGGVSVGIDKDALDRFSEEFDDARTTSEVRRRITDSDIVRDTSDKCTIEAQFSSNDNIELLYEAKEDEDASACAAKAMMTAVNINNLGRANANRRRRQTEGETDPIFNLVTVAAALEVTIPGDTGTTNPTDSGTTNPPGGDGGASVIFASYSFLFALMLLAMLMF